MSEKSELRPWSSPEYSRLPVEGLPITGTRIPSLAFEVLTVLSTGSGELEPKRSVSHLSFSSPCGKCCSWPVVVATELPRTIPRCSSMRASCLMSSTHARASFSSLAWKWKFLSGENKPKTCSRLPLGSLRYATAVRSERLICLCKRSSDEFL